MKLVLGPEFGKVLILLLLDALFLTITGFVLGGGPRKKVFDFQLMN